jgi:hypothetical protein
MGSIRKFAVAFGATAALVAFSSTPATAADQCRTACNNSYATCTKSKGPDACLPSWGQCKAKCKRSTTAVKAPAATTAKPAAKTTTTASR